MKNKEGPLLRGSIIANDCGSVEPFTFPLLQMMHSDKKNAQLAKGLKPVESLDAHPMMILCLAPLVYQTCHEMATNLGSVLILRIYYGSDTALLENYHLGYSSDTFHLFCYLVLVRIYIMSRLKSQEVTKKLSLSKRKPLSSVPSNGLGFR